VCMALAAELVHHQSGFSRRRFDIFCGMDHPSFASPHRFLLQVKNDSSYSVQS
jgi:hypothetical protein